MIGAIRQFWSRLSGLGRFLVGLFTVVPGAIVIVTALGLGGASIPRLPWQPPLAMVPDVLALEVGPARALMETAGLKSNVICLDVLGNSVTDGTVYDTDPDFGSKVDRGSVVTIYVKPPCA